MVCGDMTICGVDHMTPSGGGQMTQSVPSQSKTSKMAVTSDILSYLGVNSLDQFSVVCNENKGQCYLS